MEKRFVLTVFIVLLALVYFGCGDRDTDETALSERNVETTTAEKEVAVANLSPTQGNNVSGKVTFTKVDDGIKIVADLKGLSEGKHGFHVHEKGDCSAPDGTSAGGHFNPENKPHGAPDDSARHVGDMGNIEAGSDGNAHYERVDHLMSFSGSHSIIGKAVIVHQKADDLKSQPTGAAGARVACGVIELSLIHI